MPKSQHYKLTFIVGKSFVMLLLHILQYKFSSFGLIFKNAIKNHKYKEYNMKTMPR